MKRKKQKTLKYTALILIATLFIGIGYAKVSDNNLNIEGVGEASLPKEVLITDVTYLSDVEADTTNSKINHYTGTMLDSQIVLGPNSTSTITYQISIYNNTDQDQIFIGVITDLTDDTLYSNPNIEFSVTKLEEYVTTLSPGKSINFEITFKYNEDSDLTNNTLISKLNFRFKEIPTLILSNEGENYTLDDIYPNSDKEYEFTVSNYNDTNTNTVPMTYSFETTIDSPFIIKIYDEEGSEVTDNINLDTDSKIKHNFTLKVIWDNSANENIDYSEYENKEFVSNIILKAIPNDSEKYLEYVITKEFNINITASPFNFNEEADTDINMEKTGTILTMTINNYNENKEYNNFDTEYEISIEENDKFSFSIDGENPTNNVITRTLSGGEAIDDSFEINFTADINELDLTETLNVKIVTKTPYYKEIILPITIKLQEVKVTFNVNGGSVSPSTISVYKGKTYDNLPTPTYLGHTFNGWYTAKTGGTKITTTTEVTTSSSTQTLYAQWTSYLLSDIVKVGDYVNYNVYYNNVATNSEGTYIPKDAYNGWRVLSIEGSGDSKYVRLVTAGIPMTYKHYATSSSGTTSVTALTTNFFSTAITSTATNYKFHNCGFKTSSTATSTISTISAVQDLFENDYTQTSSSGVPLVQAMTKDDLDDVWGSTVANGGDVTSNDLLAIPSKDVSGQYAAYHLATAILYDGDGLYYLWNVRYLGGVIFTSTEHGIRPVVKLKTNVIKTGGSGTSSSPYTISIE